MSRSAIGRVRGLGSAKAGAHHWWTQRLTAAANLFVMTWLVVSLFRMSSFEHRAVVEWIATPSVAVMLVLTVISVFWHFRLGLQVVLEDYQHDETRVIALVLLNFATIAGAALAIFSILKIAFAGTPN